MLFEPLLMNSKNLDQALQMNVLIDIGRLILEQPLPSEIKGFRYTK